MFPWSRKRKAIKDTLSKYVDPDIVEAMLKPGYTSSQAALRDERVSYLLVAVDGNSSSEVNKNLGSVIEIALECGWLTEHLISNFLMLTDGGGLARPPNQQPRRALVAKLSEALGNQCKSVGGEEIAPRGVYGGGRRVTFGSMLPEFLAKVSQLHLQSFGVHADC